MRASRRHTVKTVLDDSPSTSTESYKNKEEEEQKVELVARLLRQIRAIRDRRESHFRRCLRRENTTWPEDRINVHISEKLMLMNSHVEELEKRTTGILLEDILSNSKYTNEVWHSSVQPLPLKSPHRIRSPGKALAPIEIKVEENSSLGSVTESHSLLSVNTGETNVEKAAKQEAQVMARITELRKDGLWTQSRLPLCVEPARNKTHWDYLLEEVKWMANDFRQERLFKRNMARKIAGAIYKQKREQELEVERAEQRRIKDGKRICATIARMIRDFWQNVDKVVDFRAQEILESKKRKALDRHLAFIVGEADKLSSLVQEGLVQEKTSKSPSIASKDENDDRDFHLQNDDESDDESTIAKEEKALKNHDVAGELNALAKEADQDIDELLASLPAEYLASLGITAPRTASSLSNGTSMNSVEDEASTSGDENADDQDGKPEKEPLKTPEDDQPTSPKRRRIEETEEVKTENSGSLDEGNGDGRGMLENVDYAKLHSVNSDERQQELANIAEEALKFQPKGFTLETTQVKTEVPFLIRGSLREYQMVGLDWLVTLYEKNLNGILADEMGLGKTIQTIALLAHLACSESIWGPHLIVVPTSVILNWEMEIKKWCPALKILTYFGSVNDRREKRKGWSKPNSFHVCITSYKTITSDIRSFKMKAWQYLILDEAQNIKNWKSQRWQALLNIRARRRLLLTGTPLQNSLMELWSLMHFLMPAIFASHDDFKDWFSNPLTGMMEGSVEYNAPLVQRLHKVLRPFILRRLKSEVEKQLPEKTEHVIKCPLSKRQRYLYDDFMSRRSTKDNLKSGNMMSVLNIVMQLRKCCNHPNLFEPRPVVSPFALPPVRNVMPALIFDICGENAHKQEKEIPSCLLISERFSGWSTTIKSKKPTIEEISSYEEPIVPPTVIGFNIQRPPLEKIEKTSIQATINQLNIAEIAKLGIVDGDPFLVIGEGDDGSLLLNRLEGAPTPIKLKTENGKILIDNSTSSVEKIRLCQITSELNKMSLREIGTTSYVHVQKQPSVTLESQHHEVYGVQKPRSVPVHPSLRSTTVVSNTLPLNVISGHDNSTEFHDRMAEGGARENIVNYNYQFSPPLKRRRVSDSPLISGQYKELVPENVSERLAEDKYHRLEKIRDRFGLLASPIYPNELLKVLSEETKKVTRTTDSWKWNGWDSRKKPIADRLDEYTHFIVKKFVMYVEPVQADAPLVSANSSGRSAVAIQNKKNLDNFSRFAFQQWHNHVHRVLLDARLQFPELRLIEYDCGKLQILANLLRELYLYKHRCLIFTQMSRMLDVLQAFLSFHGYQYFRLDGSTGIEQRQAMMERFNADSKIFCFILSTRSGGVGINLTGADTVIFYDSDWNPTMDAQAQDRCHRIGQTRSVSIYRLISDRTIEENILKKAIQKRRLGELAIDEAGFTPEFFKQPDNIRDLFAGELGEEEIGTAVDAPRDQKELEKAMSSLEDEQDVVAAKMASAEAKADTAEFEDKGPVSQLPGGEDVDDKYMELIGQLKPIERYAVKFLEEEYKPEFEEEVKEAEALIEQKKDDWQKAHEKAMHEENNVDDDFYGCGSLLDEVSRRHGSGVDRPQTACLHTKYSNGKYNKRKKFGRILADGPDIFDQFMPSWTPPTPPVSDSENDVYYDECLDLLYDPDFMGEARLPSTIHELHRPLAKQPSPVKRSHNTNSLSTEQTVMQLLKSASDSRAPPTYNNSQLGYSEDNDFVCNDFGVLKTDEPFAGICVPKREKSSRGRQDQRSQRDLERAVTPPRPVREELDYEGPEWNIIEDRALLEAIRNENRLKHVLEKNKCPLTYNWEFISGFVNRVTGFYRSPRQCCIRYQTAVRPRENGQLVAMDPLSKKPRKVNLTQMEVVHLRKNRVTTDMQYEHDVSSILENKVLGKIKTINALSLKSLRPFRRSLENVTIDALSGRLPQNHEAKLSEFNLHRNLAEDIVLIHEEKHFNSEQRKKVPERAPAEDRGVSPFRTVNVTVRPPAVTAGTGTVVSKAPFVLEIVPLQPVRPPAPPPQGNMQPSIQQDHNVVTYSQPGLQRRVGPISGNYPHNIQQQPAQQGYVVVSHDNTTPGIRRQEAGGQSNVNQVFRSFAGPPSRRTPPNTPITSGMTRAPMGYVTSSGQSSGNFTSNSQASSNVYPSSTQPLSTGIQRQPAGRVVPRSSGTRMYMTQGPGSLPESRYVMPSQVRMIQNTQRLPQRRTTMTNNPNGAQLTTMVMPGRSQMSQVRAVQRPATNLPPGSRIMVMAPNNRQNPQIVQGHSGAPMTRQLLTRGMSVPSRGGSPQTVAQVVIAPPTAMQQSQQSQQHHSSQPPQLTPSVVVTSSDPSPSPNTQSSQSQSSPQVSQSFSPSPQSSQQTSTQPPQLQVQQSMSTQSHNSSQSSPSLPPVGPK